jgi:predicted secreted acid phosphatase
MTMIKGRRGRCLALTFAAAAAVSLFAACSPSPDEGTAAGGVTASSADAASTTPVGLDNLNAVLWVQSAVEYRATSLQAYRLAQRALDDALADATWTAALEQTGDFAGLPPAIILDIDETVLDNAYYEARLTLDQEL